MHPVALPNLFEFTISFGSYSPALPEGPARALPFTVLPRLERVPAGPAPASTVYRHRRLAVAGPLSHAAFGP